jgi:hypothetical protein
LLRMSTSMAALETGSDYAKNIWRLVISLKIRQQKLDMAVHTCNPRGPEAGRSWVLGQSGLHTDFAGQFELHKNKKQTKRPGYVQALVTRWLKWGTINGLLLGIANRWITYTIQGDVWYSTNVFALVVLKPYPPDFYFTVSGLQGWVIVARPTNICYVRQSVFFFK